MPSSAAPRSRLSRLVIHGTLIEPHERTAVLLAFLCYFVLFASYYILRPVRDTAATVFGVESLDWLFTGTFIGTIVASPLYAWLASRLKLRRFLPAVLWFWLLNLVGFAGYFAVAPESRLLAAIYYWWFSIANLFMISIFWSLMVDLFATSQATRLFAFIASGGSFGAIAGPLITRLAVHAVGLGGLLLIAAGGFLGMIVLVHLLMREKERLRAAGEEVQQSSFDHGLEGNPFEGFFQILKSPYSRSQAGFILLMTWANTVGYFLQTEVIAKAFSAVEARAVAIADISLVVNVITAAILFFGLGHFVRRFGVTATLVANPFIMVFAFLALAFSPTLLMIQALQVVRQVTQYAIARPSREMCFTVVEQKDRYKTKNVIDTVVYRFGDLSSAWILTGLRAAGARVFGSCMTGVAFSVLWGLVALQLGRRYEERSARQPRAAPAGEKVF
jgi:ATP:ADP antiporter, AAA family